MVSPACYYPSYTLQGLAAGCRFDHFECLQASDRHIKIGKSCFSSAMAEPEPGRLVRLHARRNWPIRRSKDLRTITSLDTLVPFVLSMEKNGNVEYEFHVIVFEL